MPEKKHTEVRKESDKELKLYIHLLCGLKECSPRQKDHKGPKIYVEKALEGGAPDGRKHMYTKSDSPESHHVFWGHPCDSYTPVKQMFLE